MALTDKQLLRIATGFRKGILGRRRSSRMMCCMVSLGLQGYLGFLGLHTKVREGEVGDCNHIWLELSDGRVLDATADQFSDDETIYPPVHLGEPLKIHRARL